MTFKRENKYLVLKWTDLDKYLSYDERMVLHHYTQIIEENRSLEGKNPTPEYVCIKSTYPEYEYVWECIEERVTKKNKGNSNAN